MPLIERFSVLPSEAKRLGLEYFDLFLTGWGWRSNGLGENNVLYPQTDAPTFGVALPSVAAIAIHPNSDFDRVLVRTYPGQGNPTGGAFSLLPHPSKIDRHTTTLSVDAPIIVSPPSVSEVPGQFISSPTVTRGTLTLLTTGDDEYRSFYVREGSTVPEDFVGHGLNFVMPILALRFYLRGNLRGPIGRAPFVYRINRNSLNSSGPYPTAFGAVNVEEKIIAIPVYGRRQVTVAFRVNGTAVANLRMGAVSFPESNLDNGFESTIAAAAAVGPGTYTMIGAPNNADWIVLYATLLSGAGSLEYNVYAV